MPRSTSLWLQTTHPEKAPPLTSATRADVCVIGGGIAGLTTAYLLRREGYDVVLLDHSAPGTGETGVTTAHLSNVMDDRYTEMIRLHGDEGARIACESHRAAIARIESIASVERIACDFRRVSGYLVPAPEHDDDWLREEYDAARRAGADAEWLDRGPIDTLAGRPCLHFPRQGQFHPLKYLDGMRGAYARAGGRLFSARATFVEGGGSATVRTADDVEVTARAVVVATNVPFNDLVAVHTKQAPYHTYVIGARTPPGGIPRALYWDTHDPYHYVRLQRSTNAELGGDNSEPVDILIVGGEDHKAAQASDAEARYSSLESWMRDRFPEAAEVEFRWSGQVMETQDGVAFIGRNPLDQPNVFIATGDSGMGMTHGTIAGILLTDLIAGRENRWAGLYDPSRKRAGAIGDFLKENLNVAAQFRAYVTPGDVSSADEIAPNTGAVVRDGVHKIAVFRDEAGELHRRSAVCTHLGCIVGWNAAASTWDCPCHGSRFDPFGRVINGPASRDLGDA